MRWYFVLLFRTLLERLFSACFVSGYLVVWLLVCIQAVERRLVSSFLYTMLSLCECGVNSEFR